ncbi:MAG: VOC family protein [Catenulispora sp.]
MRLDHVSYAVSNSELGSTVNRLGTLLGATFHDGGVHPRFGTRNFVLPLAGGSYVEVVAPLDHPATDSAPFGKAVKARAEDGGGWLGWVVGVDDISPWERRLGRSAAQGHRVRPDGFDLCWKQIGVLDLMADPQLPYFLSWEVAADQRPGAGAGATPAFERLEIAGDREQVLSWIGGSPEHDPLEEVKVDWVDAEEPGVLAVHFKCNGGSVRID